MRSMKESFFLATYIVLLSMVLLNLDKVSVQVNTLMTVLNPVRNGIIIAYLLNFILNGLEKYPLRFMEQRSQAVYKARRPFAILLTFAIAIAALYAVVAVTVPELTTSFTLLMNKTPEMVGDMQKQLNQLMSELQLNDSLWVELQRSLTSYLNQLPQFISESVTRVLSLTSNIASGVASMVLDLALGVIISIYLLAGKENLWRQMTKFVEALLPSSWSNRLTYIASLTVTSFNNYVYGRLFESLIVFAMTFVGMLILQLPYAALISVIITITNLVPYVGPIVGVVPCFFLIAVLDIKQAVIFLVLDVVVQQVEGNVFGPQIFSNTLGLPGLWVIIGLAVGGGLFGLIGMLIAAPITTVLYVLLREYIDDRYRHKQTMPPPPPDTA